MQIIVSVYPVKEIHLILYFWTLITYALNRSWKKRKQPLARIHRKCSHENHLWWRLNLMKFLDYTCSKTSYQRCFQKFVSFSRIRLQWSNVLKHLPENLAQPTNCFYFHSLCCIFSPRSGFSLIFNRI